MTNFIFGVLRSGAGIFVSRVFGLVRDMVIAAVYGATGVTDIFFVAFAIPNLFRQLFTEGAMSSAFMPFLAEKLKSGGKQAQNAYLSQLIFIQGAIIGILCVVMMLLASYVIKIFLPGYSEDTQLIARGASLLRIVMPYLLLIGICGMLSGFLNIHNCYFISYASSAFLNIAMIIGAWLGYKHSGDITYLAYGVIAGGICQLVVVYFVSVIYGFKLTFFTKIDEAVKKTYLLLVPSLAGVGISQLNFLIGRILASYLPFGSISWLFYANRLFQFPLGVFSVALGAVSLTELSKASADKDAERRNNMINKAIISLIIIIIPATIGLIGLSKEIISLIYERRAFSANDVYNTATALQMYSAGLLFFSAVNVLTRIFHAEKDTKTPVKCAFFAFVANIILTLILMKPLGHAGIALASSIAAAINSVLLWKNARDLRFSLNDNKKLLIKIAAATIIMTAVLISMKIAGVNVLINIALCLVVYFGFLYALGVKVLRLLR